MSDDHTQNLGSAGTLMDGGARRAAPEPAAALPTIDRAHYRIDSELARGGMGRIFLARDRRLGRTVAVKEVLATEDAFLVRFDREVRLTARLQPPGIVSIYEAGPRRRASRSTRCASSPGARCRASSRRRPRSPSASRSCPTCSPSRRPSRTRTTSGSSTAI